MSVGHLEIRFSYGERPHVFWVSTWLAGRRFKVLSKRLADGSIEVRVVEEHGGKRRLHAAELLSRDQPSGWLDHWVNEFARSLDLKLERYDLRSVESEDEFFQAVEALGWWTEWPVGWTR